MTALSRLRYRMVKVEEDVKAINDRWDSFIERQETEKKRIIRRLQRLESVFPKVV